MISLQNTFNRKTEEEKVIEDERRKEASGSVPPTLPVYHKRNINATMDHLTHKCVCTGPDKK